MRFLDQFFIRSDFGLLYVNSTYNTGLVVLSIILAVFASGMALQTAQMAKLAQAPWHRQTAILSGTVALGGGIWTMHFIGMLAFELCTPVYYDPAITLFSILPSLGASWVALQILSRRHSRRLPILLGGVLVGLGIATMHYSGMSAMRMAAVLRYEPYTFLGSIVLAIVLATLALGVRFHMHRVPLGLTTRIIVSALLMGLAITGLHYTGMAAARFVGENGETSDIVIFNTTYASLALSAFTILFILLVSAANALIRYRTLYQRMEDSESRVRAMLDTAVDGILTLDPQGRILSLNRSAEKLFGHGHGASQKRHIRYLLSPADFQDYKKYITQFLHHGDRQALAQPREVIALQHNGSPLPLRLSIGLIDAPGEPVFVCFLSDISEYKNMADSLREAAQRAEENAYNKSLFLANISHELRTPLNAILGFSEILLQNGREAAQWRYLKIIHESAQSLQALLNDILDSSKLEHGSFHLENLNFSLKDICRQIYASLRLQADAKGLELDMQLSPALADYYQGDPLRIQQILNNLMGNAIKFTQKGKVTLRIEPQDNRLFISVQDTGIGMSPEQLTRVFKPFAQADSSISRRFGGTGLGITIVRQLVELMNGELHVRSTPDEGSEFYAWLPLPAATESSVNDQTLPQINPLHILVVDDVPLNLELMQLALERDGHQLHCVLSGQQALQHLKNHQVDLVLMDVHMPDMDGLEATRRWRQYEQAEQLAPVPFIALTASVMNSDRRAAAQAGMDGFASKPLNMHKLYQEITRIQKSQNALPPTFEQDNETTALQLINWKKGQELWGNEAGLKRALIAFLTDMETRYSLAAAYSDDGDKQALIASLHGIVGTAGNLGLETISELASTLEQELRQGESLYLRIKIAHLQYLLNKVSMQVREEPLHPPVVTSEEQISLKQAQQATQQLREYLQRHELDQDCIHIILCYLQQNQLYTYASGLSQALSEFNFTQAKALLLSLDAQLNIGHSPKKA